MYFRRHLVNLCLSRLGTRVSRARCQTSTSLSDNKSPCFRSLPFCTFPSSPSLCSNSRKFNSILAPLRRREPEYLLLTGGCKGPFQPRGQEECRGRMQSTAWCLHGCPSKDRAGGWRGQWAITDPALSKWPLEFTSSRLDCRAACSWGPQWLPQQAPTQVSLESAMPCRETPGCCSGEKGNSSHAPKSLLDSVL